MNKPLYRHHLLYYNFEKYQKNKYISRKEHEKYIKFLNDITTKQDKASFELKDVKYYSIPKALSININTNHNIVEAAVDESDELPYSTYYYDYYDRYHRLREYGWFYQNLKQLYDIVYNYNSIEEILIRLAIYGIDEKYFNYFCVYMITSNIDNFFDHDYENIHLKNQKNKNSLVLSGYKVNQFNSYCLIRNHYSDIMSKGLEICSFNEFINAKFC